MVDKSRKMYKVADYSSTWYPSKFKYWREYDEHLFSFELFHKCILLTWQFTFDICDERIN